MRFFILSIFLYSPQLFSQPINGNWKGKMYYPDSKTDTVLVEFEITGKNNHKLSGYTICHFTVDHFVKASITGKYDSVTHEVYFKENSIDEKGMPESTPVFLDEYFLNLDPEGKLTGIVRCKELKDNKYNITMPCHDDMYIDLERK